MSASDGALQTPQQLGGTSRGKAEAAEVEVEVDQRQKRKPPRDFMIQRHQE
ncbi:Hypothetical predicted protein, partial [Marmota monax]